MRDLQNGVFNLLFPSQASGSISGLFPTVWSVQYFFLTQLAKKKKAEKAASEEHAKMADDDSPTMSGLKVEYHLLPGKTKSLSRVEFDAKPVAEDTVDTVDMYRTRDAFWDGGAINFFAARYTGLLNVKEGGTYTLFLTSDESAALFIDGKRVINNKQDGNNGLRDGTKQIDLSAGTHTIEIRYVENRGSQTLRLEWEGADTNGTRTTISGDSLAHRMPEESDGQDGHDDDEHMDGDGNDSEGTTGSDGHDDDHMNNDDHDGQDDDGHMDGDDHDDNDGHTSGDDHDSDGSMGDDGHGNQDNDDHMSGDDHDDHDGEVQDGHDDSGHMGDDDGSTDDDGGPHNHGTNDAPPIPLPTSPDEVEAYVTAVKAEEDMGAHMNDEQRATEHGQLLDLVPRSEATHVAISNGDWFDPDTWYNGEIPDEGAQVLIPRGVSVRYDGESDESLFTVRIDGELSFATDVDTKILVDTMVVSPSGRLEIGTEDDPIQDGVDAQIVIANNGDIDVGWDASLLSRGVISHGSVEIHGAEKTAYLKVDDAPMAGDTEIKLAEIPDNWSVGDTIVLTGTHKMGWFYNRETGKKEHGGTQDEEVKIVSIDGDTITIDRPLEYDHDVPREDLAAYVANTSRNITFSSEDGDQTEIHHRGHVMFMHNDDVDVRYAAFDDLGRTDKSNPAFHGSDLEPGSITSESNVQGRYSLHFHKTGTEDQDNPAIALGNAVSGSAGWGFVHHSSHANLIQNVAFDVFGASFVAEDGDETGVWWQNLAIKTEGIGYGHAKTKSGPDVARDDPGRTGDGFFFSGRLVETGENIAANTTHGFVWNTRTSNAKSDIDHVDHSEAFYGRDTLPNSQLAPIQGFGDNEAFGTQVGMIVVKRSIAQDHDVRSVIDGFLNWETSNGIQLTYTSHYTLKDIDLIGTTSEVPISNAKVGFDFGNKTFDLVVNGLTVENFQTGVDFDQLIVKDWKGSDIDHILIDADLSGNDVDINGFDPKRHTILTADDLVVGRLEYEATGDTTISPQENFVFDGIKTDSIGDRDRQFYSDIQDIRYSKHILTLLKRDGYYETDDGRKVLLVEDLVADRATGELLRFSQVLTLDLTDNKLSQLGINSNGLIDLNSKAPDTTDDQVSVDNESSIIIDVLANDFDPEGDDLEIGGFTNPFKGDLKLLDDGTLSYQAHRDFVGQDTFDYWALDDHGQYTRSTVTIDVFDLA